MLGVAQLRTAWKLLTGDGIDGSERDRLRGAADSFWIATFWEDAWSEEMRTAAHSLVERILAEGPISQTIAATDDETVAEVSRQFREFCEKYTPASAIPEEPIQPPHAAPSPLYQRQSASKDQGIEPLLG